MIVGSPTILNLIPGGVNKVVHVNQVNDNIEIQFQIMNGSQPYNVTEGVSCTIRGTKGDSYGYAAEAATTVGSNVVTVTLTEQLTAVAGGCNVFELVFVGAENSMKVSTENFILAVERAALGEDTVISDSDLAYAAQVLDQLQSVGAVNAQVQQNKANMAAEISRAKAAEAAETAARQAADNTLQSNINAEASTRATQDASLQSQINQLIAPSGSAPSAAEVENARVGADGTVYQTLGDAIRTQDTQLKSAMTKEVIIEGFKRNESQAFNYLNAESNKIITTTGNKIDYNGYWITHNIPVGTATKVICNKTAFRIGFYTNNSFSYVDTIAALSATTIPSGTEYLVIEFRNAIIPFDSADAVIITLGDTISKTAKYYETNISDVKELVDDVFLKDANLAFEQGSLSSVDGSPFDSTERCRTNIILLDGLGKININGDYSIQIFLYDKDKTYLGRTTSYRVSAIYLPNVAKIYPNAVYVRFTVQSRTGSTTNVAECITNITIDYNDINRKYRYVDAYPYSYTGEKIDVSNRFDYRLFGVLYGTQAGCIYRNKLLRTNSNGTINIWDIDTLTLVNTCNIDAASPFVPHCNSAMFGKFYDDADPFPLLYVSVYNTANAPHGTCYVYRITGNDTQGYTSELKQIITIGFTNTEPWTDGNDTTPYGNFVVDAENNVLYAYTVKDADNVTRFFAFELPGIEAASVTLTVDDIVSQFDTGYIRSPQDNTFNNGKVYICSGFGVSESHAKMSVVDISSHKIVSVIDFDNNGIHFEPEMLDIYNGHLLIGESSVYEILT